MANTSVRQKKPFSVNNFSVKITYGTTTDTRFWTQCSAIKKTYASSTYSDGQSNIKFKLPGTISYEDVTITRPLTEDDDTLIKLLTAANISNTTYLQVDVQPVYRDGYYSNPVGGIMSLKYCTLMSLAFPEIDTNGDAVANIVAVVSPGFIDSQGSKAWWVEPTSASS